MGQVVQQAPAVRGKPPALANSASSAVDVQQYLTFLLSGEMYAVGILNVKEINLRGSVVPVIDLSARFGGHQTENSRRTCIVIIELTNGDEHHDIGIVVDAVSEVLEVSSADIEPPPSFGAKIRADFIAGMGKIAGKFVIILDIQKVLSVEEIASLATVAEKSVDPQ
jgi:purine-binding chemotaxis protein CheW